MKIRNILLALVVVVAAPATAQAQCAAGTCTEVMDVTGTVASNVTATVVTAMDFAAIGAALQTAIGQFSVTANQATTVSVAVTDISNGTTTITMGADCKYGADYATGTAFTGGACGATGLSVGTNNLWVRGSITAGTAATAGDYTGTATLTVSYASF